MRSGFGLPPEIRARLKALLCGVCMGLALWMVGTRAEATGHPPPVLQNLAWKLDPAGQAGWKEMAAANGWQPFEKSHGWGFGDATVWVRYTLRAASPGEQDPWVIKVSPRFLERLTLHDPVAGLELQAGLTVPRPRDSLDSVNYLFQIPALSQQREVFLRLQTNSSRLIVTDVVSMREAIGANNRMEFLMGFLMSLSGVFALMASVQWAFNRERVIGAFALKQWLATLWALFWTGFAFMLAGDIRSTQVIFEVSLWVRIWTLAATAWFFLVLIEDYKPSRAWVRASRICIAAIIALPVLQATGLPLPTRMLSNIMIPVVLTMLLGTLLSSRHSERGQAPLARNLLLAYLLVYTVLNSTPPAMNLGWIPVHPIALQLNLSHIFMDGLVMFFLLQMRDRRLLAQARQLADEQLRLTMKMDMATEHMAIERRRREEQSQFLHMLMHELKTPLSIVSLALGTRSRREENLAHAARAVQDMKTILDRCVMADKAGELTRPQAGHPLSLPELVQHQASTVAALAHRFELSAPPVLPPLHTDPQLLRIIVGNLLDNAAHYSDRHSPVAVHLSPQDRNGRAGVRMSVCNAPGPAGRPDPQRLFQKYYRANGALRESGSGLGLFLSRQLARSLGGDLDHEPHSQAIEFVLWMPLQHA